MVQVPPCKWGCCYANKRKPIPQCAPEGWCTGIPAKCFKDDEYPGNEKERHEYCYEHVCTDWCHDCGCCTCGMDNGSFDFGEPSAVALEGWEPAGLNQGGVALQLSGHTSTCVEDINAMPVMLSASEGKRKLLLSLIRAHKKPIHIHIKNIMLYPTNAYALACVCYEMKARLYNVPLTPGMCTLQRVMPDYSFAWPRLLTEIHQQH